VREIVQYQLALFFQPFKKPGSGKRSHQGRLDRVDMASPRESDPVINALFGVTFPAEDKPGNHRDPVFVYFFEDLIIRIDPYLQVEFLIHTCKLIFPFRLNAYKKHPAAAFCSILQHLFIVSHIQRCLPDPVFFDAAVDDRFEQLNGSLLGMFGIAHDVIVEDEDILLRDGSQLFHHLINGPVAVLSPVESGHGTEVTVHRAAPGGLDRGKDITRVKQVTPWLRRPDQVGQYSIVPFLQPVVFKILNDSWSD